MNKTSPKVLIGIPTYIKMKYCHKQFFNRLKELTYENKHFLIIDNTKNNDYIEDLKKEGLRVIKDKTKEKRNIKRLISSRNKIINHALENNYDYILFLDSDMIPPVNIIEQLLQSKKNIVSGLYLGYFTSSNTIKALPVAWKNLTLKEFEELKTKIKLPNTVKSHKDIRRHITKQEADSNKLIEVILPANGCMLVSKEVIKNKEIRYGLKPGPETIGQTGEDDYFIKKAKKYGFKAFCNTNAKCNHLIDKKYKKDEQGNYIHMSFNN